ncbi:MAG: alpha/beta fold hydrolase [Acidimicrobiales bacterium]
MAYREELIDLDDGRTLEVATMGSPAGATVYLHHGTPGTTRTTKSFGGLLEYGDFYLVSASRPGYGQSSRRADRSISSVIDDVGPALAHFGRDKYIALGWSGGGPHALASAALDPHCRGAVTLASVAPADADFEWTEGMGPENVEEFALAKEGGAVYEELMAATGALMGEATKDNFVEMIGGLLGRPDREVLADDQERELFVEATRHAFVNGWRGYYDDNLAIIAPWGFDVEDIAMPVHMFYGDEDLMVPPSHGRWLSTHVLKATATHHPAEGHLSIFMNHPNEVAAALLAL